MRRFEDGKLQCTKCKDWKVPEDFPVASDGRVSGRNSWCNACMNSRRKYYDLMKVGAQITAEYNYREVFEAQGGVCFLCKKAQTFRDLDIDHNHNTGKLRKLLCTTCNRFVGRIENNIELTNKILAYLEDFGA